jgi:RHS repeat-associated protein
VTPNTNPAGLGVFNYNLRFPGQYSLNESGLYYNYFRDYDPQTGRYIESDPIGLGSGVNTYEYTRGNPMSLRDPLGLWGIAIHCHNLL